MKNNLIYAAIIIGVLLIGAYWVNRAYTAVKPQPTNTCEVKPVVPCAQRYFDEYEARNK
jgi:hypothetical protein